MLHSINPRTGAERDPLEEATVADVAAAVERSVAAAPAFAAMSLAQRAAYLRGVADALEAARIPIVEMADFETGLGLARFGGELDRTTAQIRAFADVVEDGAFQEVIHTPADPDAKPPRPDLRRMLIPVGPVGVFTPSNFPLAFGVAGGDTASALAAGCTVVVKGHPSHPHSSEITARAFAEAAAKVGAPPDTLILLQSRAPEVSNALVTAPAIRAIAFTGSEKVGRLLFDVASTRPDPIPFYGELGSLNPVFIGASAAAARGGEIGKGLVASMNMGSGQFCTKPGVVFVPTGADGDALIAAIEADLKVREPNVLLNQGLKKSLDAKVAASRSVKGVREAVAAQEVPAEGFFAASRIFVVDSDTFFASPELRHEHFGPVSIVVRCDATGMKKAASQFDGQLTATIHADEGDMAWAKQLLPALVEKAGRIVWNGYPTGVAVVPAMHHGGPYPASTNSLHTSVGSTAIRRFLRPVVFQNLPESLLPEDLR
jgi:acyl-CoA reductase-like NAD-dependent aldehyde dehydrogenase